MLCGIYLAPGNFDSWILVFTLTGDEQASTGLLSVLRLRCDAEWWGVLFHEQ